MRKKRRKAVYVPYDYEAAYKNSLDKMEEANEERILKEGKVKSIYATKEIRSGDQLEVEIYPEFTKGQKDQIPDEGKRKRQRQAQKNLNDKNSKKMCERVISENFTDRDIWATFTYTDDNMPASMEVATKNMQNYIRRLNYQRKKQGLSNARYVYVTNAVKKDAGIITSLWMAMWIWTRLKQSGILEKEMRSEGFRGMKTVWSEWQGTSRKRKAKKESIKRHGVHQRDCGNRKKKSIITKRNRRMWTGS